MSEVNVTPIDGGNILTGSASLMCRNALAYGGISLIVILPSVLIVGLVAFPLLVGEGAPLGRPVDAVDVMDQIHHLGGTFVTVFFNLLVDSLVLGALAFATVQNLGGNRPRILQSIITTLPRILTIAGVAVWGYLLLAAPFVVLTIFILMLSASGVFAQAVLLLGGGIGGAMLYSAIWVAVPVAIVEGRGAVDSLRRSAELTRGRRPAIFVLILFTVGLQFLSEWLGPEIFVATEIGQYSWTGMAIEAVERTILLCWVGIVAAFTYHELRALQDGRQVKKTDTETP